jgi:hypothetical protein
MNHVPLDDNISSDYQSTGNVVIINPTEDVLYRT